MAFEDRCSPNQANSPGPHPNKTANTSPNPNDRSLKPYTCSIITPKYERPKSPIYKKNHIPNPFDVYKDNLLYHPYYSGFVPRYDYGLSIYDPFVQNQKILQARHVEMLNRENLLEEEESPNLNFSISNILSPEFGLNAIKKTTYKKEGPKSGGPTQSILYKPYELAKTSPDSKASKDPFKFAPLGKLCHAVASIPQMVSARPLKENVSGDPPRSQNDFGFSSSKHEMHRRPDSANSSISSASSSVSSQGAVQGAGGYATGSDDGASTTKTATSATSQGEKQWPAWVYCTRYSDRPSSGPRCRRAKKKKEPEDAPSVAAEDKRPRTAFSGSQLARLKREFTENRYLTERRRQSLSAELGLNEAQIKIWFQNKRAKIKKSTGQKNPLALQLMAQGLYNHTTASGSEDEEEIKVT